MKKFEFQIRTSQGLEPRTGTPVKIKAAQEHQFAAHKETVYHRDWVITELSTGMMVSMMETKELAVDMAEIRINKIGLKKFSVIVKTGKERHENKRPQKQH